MNTLLPAFSGYGIELEYMIVDRKSLSIMPIADKLLHKLSGKYVSEVAHGRLAWSNEIVLHLIELKNSNPEPVIESLPLYSRAKFDASMVSLNFWAQG